MLRGSPPPTREPAPPPPRGTHRSPLGGSSHFFPHHRAGRSGVAPPVGAATAYPRGQKSRSRGDQRGRLGRSPLARLRAGAGAAPQGGGGPEPADPDVPALARPGSVPAAEPLAGGGRSSEASPLRGRAPPAGQRPVPSTRELEGQAGAGGLGRVRPGGSLRRLRARRRAGAVGSGAGGGGAASGAGKRRRAGGRGTPRCGGASEPAYKDL